MDSCDADPRLHVLHYADEIFGVDDDDYYYDDDDDDDGDDPLEHGRAVAYKEQQNFFVDKCWCCLSRIPAVPYVASRQLRNYHGGSWKSLISMMAMVHLDP